MKPIKYTLLAGDCIERLRELPDNSVDSVVTDPPYGLSKEPDIAEVLTKWIAGEPYDHGHGGFMGKAWDSFVPHPDIWREVYRVLKPGGHALVFAGTRTQDLMTVALRLSGFEVRDVIEWLYFSGFPKSHDVGKAFDRRAGVEREVIGVREEFSKRANKTRKGVSWADSTVKDGSFSNPQDVGKITAPATDLARQWDGWGTALKPAHEPIIVVRKPLIDADTGRKMTVVDCVEKYGTGAVNIDGARIGERFPANSATTDEGAFYSKYFNVSPPELSKKAAKKDRNSDWQGGEISLEPKETSLRYNVKEGRGRLTERPKTVTQNNHPTVKPTDLMAWLVRLVTPTGGTTLDPFAGSGSTLVAARREGFGFIGIEREQDYVKIIEARAGVNAV